MPITSIRGTEALEIPERGPSGLKGDKPGHVWTGPQLSFQNPDGSYETPVNLLGPEGPSGGTQRYQTRAQAAAATIGTGINTISVDGFSTAGDGGASLYKRVVSAPAHNGKFRSVDRFLPNGSTDAGNGGWWELAEARPSLAMFGAFGGLASTAVGSLTDDTVAIQSAFDFVGYYGIGGLYAAPRTYKITSPIIVHAQVVTVFDAEDNLGAGLLGIHFNRSPQMVFWSDGDCRFVAGSAMTRMFFLTDNGSGFPGPQWWKCEGISFDGNNLATRCIETYYAINVALYRCKFTRAFVGFYNAGFGLLRALHNTFYTTYGIYCQIVGGDDIIAYNDFYPRLNGAGVYLAAGVCDMAIINNIFSVTSPNYPARGIVINGADGIGVPALPGGQGFFVIRDIRITGNEFHGGDYAVLIIGLTAAQRNASGHVFRFNEANIWNVLIEGNHLLDDSSPATGLCSITDARDIIIANNFLVPTQETPTALGINGIRMTRCKNVNVNGNNLNNYFDYAVYGLACDNVALESNIFENNGNVGGSARQVVAFDSSGSIYAINNRFRRGDRTFPSLPATAAFLEVATTITKTGNLNTGGSMVVT